MLVDALRPHVWLFTSEVICSQLIIGLTQTTCIMQAAEELIRSSNNLDLAELLAPFSAVTSASKAAYTHYKITYNDLIQFKGMTL